MPVKCDTVLFNIVNARTVRLTGGTKSIEPHKFDKKIVSLQIKNRILSVGETVSVKKNKFKINIIEKKTLGNILVYELHMAKQTKSNIFLLPMLSGERRLYFYDTHLINTFIGTEEQKDCIALLYRWSNDPLFLKFDQAVRKFRSYRMTEDLGNDLVLYIFDVPIKHRQNYNNFINGKYSELTPKYKTSLLKFHGMNIDGQIGQILFKSEKRKARLETKLGCTLDDDAELYSIIDPNIELFNPNYYI